MSTFEQRKLPENLDSPPPAPPSKKVHRVEHIIKIESKPKMKNYDSHIYLYAKHWYKVTNVIDDLKILYGKRNGIDPKYISINNILQCLVTLTTKHINEPRHFQDFINDLSPDNCWRVWRFGSDSYEYWKAVISKCLSVLSLTKIDEIENGLDEPDYSLLPKKDKQDV